MDKNDLKWILLFIILGFLICCGNISIQSQEKPVRYINVYLNISNYSNAWMEADNIYFFSQEGKTIKGSTIITNNEDKKAKFNLKLEGELFDNRIISISESSFELETGKEKQIEIKLNITKDAKSSYSGKIKITS
jgi:hypothetical protein